MRPRRGPRTSTAAAAIIAAHTPWPTEPSTHRRLRAGWDTTHGVRAACGSMEPDSRKGTSRPVKKPGTPAALNSQGRTVLPESN